MASRTANPLPLTYINARKIIGNVTANRHLLGGKSLLPNRPATIDKRILLHTDALVLYLDAMLHRLFPAFLSGL